MATKGASKGANPGKGANKVRGWAQHRIVDKFVDPGKAPCLVEDEFMEYSCRMVFGGVLPSEGLLP